MGRPKVFVTQEVLTANYAAADWWGDVVFLSVAEISNVPNSLHNRKLVAAIRERMESFNPETDYIAPSGSPIITGVVFAIAREKTSVFNVLKWNSRDKAYTAAQIDVTKDEYVY